MFKMENFFLVQQTSLIQIFSGTHLGMFYTVYVSFIHIYIVFHFTIVLFRNV
jgi:hypothetical protein